MTGGPQISRRPPEYLDAGETAELIRTTTTALYTQRSRGTFPGSLGVKVGRKVLFRRDDISQWFEVQRHEQYEARG